MKKIVVPEIYADILNETDYRLIIDICIKYHEEREFKIISVDDGDIQLDVNDQIQHRYLDNVVRVLAQNKKSKWKDILYQHFEKLKDTSSASTFLYKDFEHASPRLRVLIKKNDFNVAQGDKHIRRCDLPGTFTYLVLDINDQFSYVLSERAKEWDKDINELFDIALGNTPYDDIQVSEYNYLNKFPLFGFFSGDFSASLMLDLKESVEYAIGTYGSLIAIPTKGTAFAHPIETRDILDLVIELMPTIEKFYLEDPGSITMDFYWYYKYEYQILPFKQNGENATIGLPEKLIDIFKMQS